MILGMWARRVAVGGGVGGGVGGAAGGAWVYGGMSACMRVCGSGMGCVGDGGRQTLGTAKITCLFLRYWGVCVVWRQVLMSCKRVAEAMSVADGEDEASEEGEARILPQLIALHNQGEDHARYPR
jgi:hypothetical protein